MAGMKISKVVFLSSFALLCAAPAAQAQTGQDPSSFKLQPKETPRVDPSLQGPGLETPRDDKVPPTLVTPKTSAPVRQPQPVTPAAQVPDNNMLSNSAVRRPSRAAPTQSATEGGATQGGNATRLALPVDVATNPSGDTSAVNTVAAYGPAPTLETAPSNASMDGAAVANGGGGFLWPVALGLFLLTLLGGFLLFRRRDAVNKDVANKDVANREVKASVESAAPGTTKDIKAAAKPMVARETPIGSGLSELAPQPKRAWLEIDFEPTDARSTSLSASLGYKLTVRNTGDLDAVGITVDALMTSSGEQQNLILARFYAQDISQPIAELESIPADGEVVLNGQFDLGTKDIYPIRVADRLLLIPLVAFSVRYDRGDGRGGQTDQAFVIGRENNPPSDKMGPFRLDLGPRHYKSVGKREHIAVRRA